MRPPFGAASFDAEQTISLDVIPELSVDDLRDRSLRQTESFCKFVLIGLSRLIEASQFPDLIVGQLAVSVPHTIVASPLGDFVSNVVSVSTNSQMLHIDATRVVACVPDYATGWQRSVLNDPSHPVGQYRVFTITIEHPVAVFLAGCPLYTAVLSLSGLTPESLHLDRASGRLAVLPFGIVVEPCRYYIG